MSNAPSTIREVAVQLEHEITSMRGIDPTLTMLDTVELLDEHRFLVEFQQDDVIKRALNAGFLVVGRARTDELSKHSDQTLGLDAHVMQMLRAMPVDFRTLTDTQPVSSKEILIAFGRLNYFETLTSTPKEGDARHIRAARRQLYDATRAYDRFARVNTRAETAALERSPHANFWILSATLGPSRGKTAKQNLTTTLINDIDHIVRNSTAKAAATLLVHLMDGYLDLTVNNRQLDEPTWKAMQDGFSALGAAMMQSRPDQVGSYNTTRLLSEFSTKHCFVLSKPNTDEYIDINRVAYLAGATTIAYLKLASNHTSSFLESLYRSASGELETIADAYVQLHPTPLPRVEDVWLNANPEPAKRSPRGPAPPTQSYRDISDENAPTIDATAKAMALFLRARQINPDRLTVDNYKRAYKFRVVPPLAETLALFSDQSLETNWSHFIDAVGTAARELPPVTPRLRTAALGTNIGF